jgi:hypothetical protein
VIAIWPTPHVTVLDPHEIRPALELYRDTRLQGGRLASREGPATDGRGANKVSLPDFKRTLHVVAGGAYPNARHRCPMQPRRLSSVENLRLPIRQRLGNYQACL